MLSCMCASLATELLLPWEMSGEEQQQEQVRACEAECAKKL